MRILVVGSKVQQMPGPLFAFERLGHKVALYRKSVEELGNNEENEKELETFLKKHKVDFVFSNVFGRLVAKVTNRLDMKYAVWCMDSPAFVTYMPEAAFDNCYLFYFDYREYELRKQEGLSNVYHLPLAADVVRSGGLTITDEEIKKYGCDMSFVGILYTQNMYDQLLERFPKDMQDVFTDMMEKSVFVWDGQNRLYMQPELVSAVRSICPEIFDGYYMPDEYFCRTFIMGRKLTHVERTLLIELLAQRYDIHLYTRDTEQVPEGVRRFPEVDSGDGALKVFYSSKVNLNITLRSIASGVPARVFEVMSVGGFMLTNWQEEIPEMFAEDKEIVTYKTPEELVDKADYYLRHDNERIRIGVNGYQKVKEHYTYEHRLRKIISILFPSP